MVKKTKQEIEREVKEIIKQLADVTQKDLSRFDKEEYYNKIYHLKDKFKEEQAIRMVNEIDLNILEAGLKIITLKEIKFIDADKIEIIARFIDIDLISKLNKFLNDTVIIKFIELTSMDAIKNFDCKRKFIDILNEIVDKTKEHLKFVKLINKK